MPMDTNSLPTSPQINRVTPPSSPIRRVFFGEDGLRAGWRFLIFVVLLVMCVVAIRLGLRQMPPLRRVLDQAQSGTMTSQLRVRF